MASSNTGKVGEVITTVLKGLDEDIATYLTSVLEDDPLQKVRVQFGSGRRARRPRMLTHATHPPTPNSPRNWKARWAPSC